MTRTAQTSLLAMALLAIMAATRSHHFTSLLGPGDATLAVFFLGGLFLRRAGWLGLFLATAGVIDFLAVQGGTSAWCITPGYALLAPAYGALWLAGRLSTGALDSAAGLLRGAGLLASAVLVFLWSRMSAFMRFRTPSRAWAQSTSPCAWRRTCPVTWRRPSFTAAPDWLLHTCSAGLAAPGWPPERTW